MKVNGSRRLETIIYASVWVLVAGLFILNIMRSRSLASLPLCDAGVWSRVARCLVPFLTLFLVHNYLLVPRLLLRNRLKAYFAFTGLLILVVLGWQAFQFVLESAMYDKPPMGHMGPRGPRPPRGGDFPKPILPLPLLLDVVYDLLIVGANLALALIFQRYDDRLERERLLKSNAETGLAYLKAQINPHFYMNMLNNIHGLIDIDPARAQQTLIDMSNLMRYMIYDSACERISLQAEIAFLKNYLRLMRQRYPADKVRITASFPDERRAAGVMVAPLLFLVFVENAFKHGISYARESYVSVALEVDGGEVLFTCLNSRQPGPDAGSATSPGIGLANVERRLNLIYGHAATLRVEQGENSYNVSLTIPAHEDKNADN